jgi:hypothetical protein
MANLMVEKDEPHWSINLKKAIASQLQLDITGWRSELNDAGDGDGGSILFGERHSAPSVVDTFEVRTSSSSSTSLALKLSSHPSLLSTVWRVASSHHRQQRCIRFFNFFSIEK